VIIKKCSKNFQQISKIRRKKKRFTLELKTSARNYNLVKIHCSLDKKGKKKGPVGCKYWVVRKVLKWRWLALLPVRLLLFAGGPSVRQRRCAAAVAGWWTR
jgi:hypothetical protein